MESNADQVYLVLPIIALAVLGFAVARLFYIKEDKPGVYAQAVLLTLAGLAFVFLGVGTINTLTNGRGAPGETAPWLVLIALAAGIFYSRLRRKRASSAPQRIDGESAGQPQREAPRVKSTSAAGVAEMPRPPFERSDALIFVSYRRSDSADVAGRIYDRLVPHFGRNGVFKDVDSIPLGVDFRKHLADAVGKCHVLLAVVGKGWLANDEATSQRRVDDPRDFVRIEIESALERNIPVIPVLVQGAAMPSLAELPASLLPLAYRNAIDVRSDPDFHQDVGRLIKGIEGHLPGDSGPSND